jgi:integrase
MSKRGENIYHRADGRWEGRYVKGQSDTGKTRFGYVYSRSYTEVRRLLSEKRNSRQIEAQIEGKISGVKLQEWFAVWLERARPALKQSTFARYSYVAEKYILPTFGGMKLCNIFDETVRDFANLQLSSLSVKSVKDMLNILFLSLKSARKEGYRINNSFEVTLPKNQPKEIDVLSEVEQARLERHIMNEPTPRNLGILLCLYTGIRLGELCALQWRDISFAEKTLSISKTVQRIRSKDETGITKVIIDSPKSKCAVRVIPLPDFLSPILESAKGKTSEDTYILTSNNRPMEPRTYQYFFKSLLKKCGVKAIPFHALRHSFASRCVETGFDVKSLSQILGHATVNITLNVYVHSSMTQKRAQMTKLSPVYAFTPSDEPSARLAG